MVPVSWLLYNHNCLRFQTVAPSQHTSGAHRQHRHSHEASQRAERRWDGARQMVVVQLQEPAATIEDRVSSVSTPLSKVDGRSRVVQHHQCPHQEHNHSLQVSQRAE
jgi:hypothetical protein